MSVEDELKQLDRVFSRLYGPDGFPRAMIGDIHDLLSSLEKASSLIRTILGSKRVAKRELERRLYQLEIMIEDDLPMIFNDLLPAIKQLRGGEE